MGALGALDALGALGCPWVHLENLRMPLDALGVPLGALGVPLVALGVPLGALKEKRFFFQKNKKEVFFACIFPAGRQYRSEATSLQAADFHLNEESKK